MILMNLVAYDLWTQWGKVRVGWIEKVTLTYIGEGDGTPLQYSCLENPMDGGAL